MELKLQIDEVKQRFKTLSYNEIDNSFKGELFISEDDSYDVEILLDSYPNKFPVVYETGERIPREVYRHTYSDTGACCLTTEAKAQILLKTKIKTLLVFINEIVIPYFQNNSYFEINRKYKTEEYAHNKFGIIEGYRDILLTKNDLFIARLILHRIEAKKIKLHDLCYCGSGQVIKKCNNGKHYSCYKDFRKIDIDILKKDLSIFIELLKPKT